MTSSTDQFSASTPFEVPEQMRAFAEKNVSQARDNYAKFKDAAETHSGTVEAVFTTASKGASEYTAKLMEFLKANTTSTLDFAQELFGVKTPAEATELWTSHSRKSLETFSVQAKELAELGQKVATETVEPIKTSASKYYKPAAAFWWCVPSGSAAAGSRQIQQRRRQGAHRRDELTDLLAEAGPA